MADFLVFDEGKTDLASNGLPSTCTFDLSTLAITGGGLEASDTYGGGYGLVTGTGYSAKTESEPTPSAGVVSFAAKAWDTGTATDWPNAVKSLVLRNGTSKLLCAWHLQAGGTARDMSAAHTTETVTPTLTFG